MLAPHRLPPKVRTENCVVYPIEGVLRIEIDAVISGRFRLCEAPQVTISNRLLRYRQRQEGRSRHQPLRGLETRERLLRSVEHRANDAVVILCQPNAGGLAHGATCMALAFLQMAD